MKICVFASGSKGIDKKYSTEAYNLGKKIAQSNHELIYGGGSDGLMGAVAWGVNDNNGRILSILPEWMSEYEDIFLDSDEFIYTKTMSERKKYFIEKSDVFIILPGGLGTLDELLEVMTLKKLSKHNKLIVLLNTDNFYEYFIRLLDDLVTKKAIPKNNMKLISIADSIDEVFDLIESYDSSKKMVFDI